MIDFDPKQVERVVLVTTRLCPRACDVFTPREMEERILWHQQRVFRDCPVLQRGDLLDGMIPE